MINTARFSRKGSEWTLREIDADAKRLEALRQSLAHARERLAHA
jgi:hypothetical protein